MRPVTPSACSRWRTSVVLPAPRSPCSAMKALASSGCVAPVRCKGGGGGFVCRHQPGRRQRFLQWGRDDQQHSNRGSIRWRPRGRHDAGLGPGTGILPNWRGRCGFVVCGSRFAGVACRTVSTVRWATWPRHGLKRARPAELVPGTLSVITARMDYLPTRHADGWPDVELAAPAASAGGHVCRSMPAGGTTTRCCASRLQKLAEQLAAADRALWATACSPIRAPVLEAELAARSGQGWRGKHTLLLQPRGRLHVFSG